jgi:hypothetical protein
VLWYLLGSRLSSAASTEIARRVLSDAREHGNANTILILQGRLPSIWRDVYMKMAAHEPNLVRFRCRTFEYICDGYSQLEMTGAVPYDQTIADRVIGVLGRSSRAQQDRDVRRLGSS